MCLITGPNLRSDITCVFIDVLVMLFGFSTVYLQCITYVSFSAVLFPGAGSSLSNKRIPEHHASGASDVSCGSLYVRIFFSFIFLNPYTKTIFSATTAASHSSCHAKTTILWFCYNQLFLAVISNNYQWCCSSGNAWSMAHVSPVH